MPEIFEMIASGPHFIDAAGLKYRLVGLLRYRKPHTRYLARLQNMEDPAHTLVIAQEDLWKNLLSTCGLPPERSSEFCQSLMHQAHQQEDIISANLPEPSQMGITVRT